MKREEMIRAVVAALDGLQEAARGLQEAEHQIIPNPPMIRPRKIRFSRRMVWPGNDLLQTEVKKPDGRFDYYSVIWSKTAAEIICQDGHFRPRQVLRSVRRIQAAVAWCRARVEGYKRAAADIERAQSRAVEALEAEAALAALKK